MRLAEVEMSQNVLDLRSATCECSSTHHKSSLAEIPALSFDDGLFLCVLFATALWFVYLYCREVSR